MAQSVWERRLKSRSAIYLGMNRSGETDGQSWAIKVQNLSAETRESCRIATVPATSSPRQARGLRMSLDPAFVPSSGRGEALDGPKALERPDRRAFQPDAPNTHRARPQRVRDLCVHVGYLEGLDDVSGRLGEERVSDLGTHGVKPSTPLRLDPEQGRGVGASRAERWET
jgi:hypothetical protein